MADSALESAKIVTLSYQSKVKDNDVNESSSTTNVKTPACGSLHPSSPSRIMDGVATGNVPLDNQAASTTKKTADSDKKKKSKMADEARSNSRAYEAIRLTSGGETREMSVNEHFDGQQRRSLITSALVNDEKKRRRSDRYDSSESSDSGVASLTCSDASSWSSSSDITEPVSPASPSSSQSSPISPTLLDNSATNHCLAINSTRKEQKTDSKKKCRLNGVHDKQLGSTSVSVLSPFPCITSQKRCRRHSDSTSTEMSRYHKSDVPYAQERGKRVRHSSGESISNCNSFANIKERPSTDVGDLAAKQKWFALLWRKNGSNALSEEKNQSFKQLNSCNQRQSWPLAKHLQQKSGQLKITEFFSSQVKQHWNYTRFSDVDNKDVKLPVCLSNSNWRLPASRVAIVSVAQVNHHSDDVSFNPRSLPENTGFERSVPATRPSPDCGFPAKAPGPVPIRFPIDQVTSCHKNGLSLPIGVSVLQCLWQHCKSRLTSGQSLLEHIQNVHVVSQSARPVSLSSLSGSDAAAETAVGVTSCDELYSCQWEGCKVQGRTSSSRAWLERHVLLHGGHKPFRCIVDLCEQRFNSQAALQRHVNAHFNQEAGQSSSGHGIKRDSAPAKIMRRNSKKLKHRRNKVAPARLFDFFDSGVMERLRHQLINSQVTQNRIGVSCITNDLIVRSQIIARRLDANGKSRVLLRWIPEDVLPDQWVLEEEVVTQKTVAVRNLSSAVQIELQKLLIRPAISKENESKHRRKR